MRDEKETTTQFSVRLPLSVLGMLDKLARAGFRNRTQEVIRLISEEGDRWAENKPDRTP